jgi:glycosyltransferase involved in cell wall biosynthesis
MIKILFLIDGLRSGGKERRLFSLIEKLHLDRFYRIEIVVLNPDIHFLKINEFKIGFHILDRKKYNSFLLFKKLFKIFTDFKPNIVHTWDTLSTLYAIPLAKAFNKKLIVSKITDAPHFYTKASVFGILSEICFYFADLILANSNAGINAYRVSERKSQVIYNGFDFDRIKNLIPQLKVKRKFNISEHFLVGMAASFNANKDYETFLSSAQLVRKEYPNIGFVCIGDGKLRKHLENKYAASGIYFTGKQQDVESIMNTCSIGVLLSNNGEGISNSLVEFMALKKLVIASATGGNLELIENNVSGLLLIENDSKLLAKTIIFCYNNKEYCQRMGIKGRERIATYFEISLMVDKFKTVYNKIYCQ